MLKGVQAEVRPGCCPSWDLCFVRTAWCCGNAHSPKQTALHLNNHLNRTELDDTFWQEPPRLSGIDKGEGGGEGGGGIRVNGREERGGWDPERAVCPAGPFAPPVIHPVPDTCPLFAWAAAGGWNQEKGTRVPCPGSCDTGVRGNATAL